MGSIMVRYFAALGLALFVAAHPAMGQIAVHGRVLDSGGGPVGGVDVALYVPGQRDPVNSMKTDPKTGAYRFEKPALAGAFDIVYSHSIYESVFVTRLAHNNSQEITKVIYRKGEPKPSGAVQERFLSARRYVFLLASLENAEDRRAFMSRFHERIWLDLDQPIEKMSSEKQNKDSLLLLQRDQQDTLRLRTLVPTPQKVS